MDTTIGWEDSEDLDLEEEGGHWRSGGGGENVRNAHAKP